MLSPVDSLFTSTVFVPLATQGAYQSHFRWELIKTLISRFFSLKLVIFDKKNQWITKRYRKPGSNMTHVYFPKLVSGDLHQF